MIQIHNCSNIRKRLTQYLGLLCLCVCLLPSCKTSQILTNDQYKLQKNTISFKSSERIQDKDQLRLKLESLYRQLPNPSRIWPPSSWFSKDSLTIYNAEIGQETAESMEKYLRNKKGFYNANVKHTVALEGQNLSANYLLDLGIRYRVNKYDIKSNDETIEQVIKDLPSSQLIRSGDTVDSEIFEAEKSRITSGLQNLGYANFVRNYIEVLGDSSNYQVDVEFNILVPPPDSIHKKYYVGQVNVYTEHIYEDQPTYQIQDTFDAAQYFAKSDKFIVKPKMLRNSIFLRQDELFVKENRLKTNQSLNNLSSYRYAYIDEKINTDKDSIVDFDIFLSPYQHKWISDTGLDVFYSTFGTNSQQNLFGISASTSLQNRNLFRGSEKYSFNLDGSIEVDVTNLRGNRWTFGANNALELPRLVDLFGFGRFLDKVRILPKDSYQRFQEEAQTDIALGYNYSKSIDNFAINAFNASWGYTYRASQRTLYKVRQLGLNLFLFEPTLSFQMRNLDNNPLLANSFEDNLSTGFLFRDLSYYHQKLRYKNGQSLGFLGNIEISGLEVYLANELSNLITSSDAVWEFGPNRQFNFAKYIKLETDTWMYKDVSRRSYMAGKIDIGIAIPYGRTNEGDFLTTPYLSQFYVGGPNSIRAWQLRELGPGSYNAVIDPPFFQAGDIKMEASLEYRWDWFWFFEGAVFVDAGNIWTLRDERDNDGQLARPGSKISGQFLDEMAIGTGWGIRADFSYFMIRLDFGYKLRTPYPIDESGSHFVFGKTIPETGQKYNGILGNINVAINYPFGPIL